MVQDHGRYFGMPTGCLRAGYLTRPSHSGVELHGFLRYLIRCNLEAREYIVFGCKDKQVRDNIHLHDVAAFIYAFIEALRIAEVDNIGGGRNNVVSILEDFELVSSISGQPMKYRYDKQHRSGDHMCYISYLAKVRAHYPGWNITRDLQTTSQEIHDIWISRSA